MKKIAGIVVIAYAVIIGGITFHYQVKNNDIGVKTVLLIFAAAGCFLFAKNLITDGTASEDI